MFLFSAIAFSLCNYYGKHSFYVYENGITSMNLPKQADVINARASRTTHPKTLGLLRKFYKLDEYLTLQTLALEHGGTIPNEELLKHLDRATEINKRIPLAHDAEYQRLFNMKRDVFERIYAEIEAEANQKLQFRK